MNTCCPNDVACVCTECGTATVAGAGFDLTTLIVGAVALGLGIVAIRFRGRLTSMLRARPATLVAS